MKESFPQKLSQEGPIWVLQEHSTHSVFECNIMTYLPLGLMLIYNGGLGDCHNVNDVNFN